MAANGRTPAFSAHGILRRALLDMNSRPWLAETIGQTIDSLEGTWFSGPYLWRLGPGHLGAIVSVAAKEPRSPDFYKRILAKPCGISHLTVEAPQHR